MTRWPMTLHYTVCLSPVIPSRPFVQILSLGKPHQAGRLTLDQATVSAAGTHAGGIPEQTIA